MLRLFFVALAVTCSSFSFAQENTTDKQVMKAAEGQLEAYLNKIKPGHAAEFGFREGDDLENCGIAKPYRMLTFNTEYYSGSLKDNGNYVEIRNEWRVPVTVKGEHRVLLTVNGNPGNFDVAGMGGAELAKELEIKSAPYSDNDEYYILRIYPLSADFFVAEHDHSFAETEFIPLESAKTAIPEIRKSTKTTYTLEEVQDIVKRELKQGEVKPLPKKKQPAKKRTKK